MAVVIQTRDGFPNISDSEIRAVTRNATRQADLTAVALKATGLFASSEGGRPDWSRLPPGYLLELGSTLQIGLWERQGLLPHLDSDLPSFREAAQTLVDRAVKGPAEFGGADATPLCRRVTQVYLNRFAWDAPELLDAEVVLGDADEDDFVDLLAEFVWTRRHELEHLVRGDKLE